ncbi:hypothetical protein TNCV_3906621 [Trichonephila clavipes]|nr:hypothetical protein TNCV_3906621 [Trichonephila clavipes]
MVSPHIKVRSVKRLPDQHFGDRIISRYYPFPWPKRSPDLTPMAFWFWGYLKSTVYLVQPSNIVGLKGILYGVRLETSSCHVACSDIVHRLPHAMRNCLDGTHHAENV